MNLIFFDKNFLQTGQMVDFEMSQYEICLLDTGNFEIHCSRVSRNLLLLKMSKFVLFRRFIMGEILYLEYPDESSIIVKGKMLKNILTKRCIFNTAVFSNKTRSQIAKSFVETNFINPSDAKRKIDKLKFSNNAIFDPPTETVATLQKTGGSVSDALIDVLGKIDIGFDVVPIVSELVTENGSETNVPTLEFRLLPCKDKSRLNENADVVVEFSKELGNLLSFGYELNMLNEKNVAYVAGEAQEDARVVIECGAIDSYGLDRIELYVDARDIQSEDGERTLTAQEYNNSLLSRGEEKLVENSKSEIFDCKINCNYLRYEFGFCYERSESTDGKIFYEVGDFVSIYDKDLDVFARVQITKVTVSETSSGQKIDITYGKDNIKLYKINK